jgi:hypothetical protein
VRPGLANAVVGFRVRSRSHWMLRFSVLYSVLLLGRIKPLTAKLPLSKRRKLFSEC